MNFALVLDSLQAGKTARRKQWAIANSRVQRIYLVDGSTFAVSRPPLNRFYPEGTMVTYQPHIDALFNDGSCGVWDITQADVLATDWEVLESL